MELWNVGSAVVEVGVAIVSIRTRRAKNLVMSGVAMLITTTRRYKKQCNLQKKQPAMR